MATRQARYSMTAELKKLNRDLLKIWLQDARVEFSECGE
jgi:hypothetical protein